MLSMDRPTTCINCNESAESLDMETIGPEKYNVDNIYWCSFCGSLQSFDPISNGGGLWYYRIRIPGRPADTQEGEAYFTRL